MKTADRPPPALRLNPFVFPSDTDFRFVLLVVSVISSSIMLFLETSFSLPTLRSAAESIPVCLIGQAGLIQAGQQHLAALLVCIQTAMDHIALWTTVPVALLAATTGFVYWTAPRRKIRRRNLRPLTLDGAPELAGLILRLDELAWQARLRDRPTFLWNPLDPSRSAVAFGRPGRRFVALGGGLAIHFSRDPSWVVAVIRHELAHLRNGDVDKSYLTMAAWQSFLIFALAPFAYRLTQLDWRHLPAIGGWVGALTLMVYLSRNAVLRSRERFADVRASMWDGPRGSLRQALRDQPETPRSWWYRIWSVHPHPESRLRLLDDTASLFTLRALEAVGVGVAASMPILPLIAAATAAMLAWSSARGHFLNPTANMAIFFSPTVLIALATAAVGLGVWRDAVRAACTGARSTAGVWLAAGLAAGLALGGSIGHLPFLGYLLEEELAWEEWVSVALATGLSCIFWAILLSVALMILFEWITRFAEAWMPSFFSELPPRRLGFWAVFLASSLMSFWIVPLWLAGSITVPLAAASILVARHVGTPPSNFDPQRVQDLASAMMESYDAEPLLLPLGVILFLSLTATWALPLSAALKRSAGTEVTAPGWLFIDSSPPRIALTVQATHLGWALRTGLAGGALYLALLCLLVGLQQNGWTFFVTAAAVQVLTALASAGRKGRFGRLHGLLSVFVAGCAISAQLTGLFYFRGVLDGRLLLATFLGVQVLGALLTVPAFLVSSAASRLLAALKGSRET